jgi:uncharacterized protein (TIGR02996 family)
LTATARHGKNNHCHTWFSGAKEVTVSATKLQFLARLREDPADLRCWLVFADWLEEHGEPTAAFIRLSLELTASHLAVADAEAKLREFEKLLAVADVETRELLAEYRSSLPTRFRVLEKFFIGEDPPQEMFGYARTVAAGFLESGRVKVGMVLSVPTYSDGRPRVVQTILLLDKDFDEITAGRPPIHVGLGWLGHLPIEVGSVLSAK